MLSQMSTAADRAAPTYRLAAAVLAEMQRRGVVPIPRNYDLWFTYRSNTNPVLTQRMAGLLEEGRALTPDLLDTLYSECVAGAEVDLDAISSGSDAIQQAAQTLVEQVAGSQAAIQGYGDTLAHWAKHLGDEPTIGGLVGAIATLTAETTRASERNRVLEQQLAASTARIAKLRQSLAEVKQEATTDALTGVCNRRAFDARIKRVVAQARSEAAGAAQSLLLVDIDHFKRFNDLHGHRTGDLVLRLVARLLADNVKGRDCVARYGGEEFAILLAGADLGAAAVVARQIGEALSSKRLVNKGTAGGLSHVTVSVGVAQARPGESAATLVERADQALYKAKHTGRNRVCTEADLALAAVA
jgi:diguanylate cyclase